MPSTKPQTEPLPEDAEPTPAVLHERARVLALLAMHQQALEAAGLWPRLVNLVNSGRDPRDQRDGVDRLQGF